MTERPVDPDSGLPFASMIEALSAGSSDAWAVHYRAQAMEAEGEDVIILSVGDPDFDTPSPIVESAVEALRAGYTRYSPAGGIPALRSTIAATESRRLGLTVAPEEIVVSAGAQNALYTVLRCLVEQGDEVVVFSPPYIMFDGVVLACGAQPVRVPLAVEGGFRVDPADLAAAITPRTRAVLLNSPQNPTGAVALPEETEAVARLCREHGLWLISNEVYADLCYEREFQSPITLPGMRERTVIVRSLSKSHAMPGWRLGWTLAPARLSRHMVDLVNHVLYGGARFIQEAAITALTAEIPDCAAMKQAYRLRRDFLCDALDEIPGLRAIRPESGLFCLVDVAGLGLPTQTFAEHLLEREGVAVLPAGGFGPEIDHCVRISLCQPQERLAEAVRRMTRFVQGLEEAPLARPTTAA